MPLATERRLLREFQFCLNWPHGRRLPKCDVHRRDPQCPVHVETGQVDWVRILDGCLFQRPVRREDLERLAGLDQHCRGPRRRLITSHDDVHVKGVELNASADALGLFGRDQGRA